MKQILTFILLLCSYALCGAQATSLTVDNQTPGWLSSKINYGDQQTVENITITGYVNQTDLSFIGSLMSKHNLNGHIDLTDVKVVDTDYAENPYSDKTMFELQNSVNISRLSLPKSLPGVSQYLLSWVITDTLDYGSERCDILTKFLVANGFCATNNCPKVLILREGVHKIEKFGTDEGEEKNLQTLILPETIDSIGIDAFYSCLNLSSVNLPNSIHSIGVFAFAETSFKPDTLYLPSNLEVFHTTSFPQNPGQVIVVPNTTKEIDNDPDATRVDHLTIYSGIKRDDYYTLIINRLLPPKFMSSSYFHVDLSSCNIFVPKEGLSYYKDKKYDPNQYGDGGNPYSYANIFSITVPVEGLMLNYTSYTLNVGSTIELLASIQPSNADNSSVSWESSNPNIAQVNQEGKVTALSSGITTIKVISKENPNIFATCEIAVHQPLTSISLTPANIKLNAGETYNGFIINYTPATADNKNVVWQSSNSSIVTVDDNGILTAIKGGEAKIIVSSVENPTIKAESFVTIIQPVTGISLNKSAIELVQDETDQLIATITPENASNKGVTWTSSDISIAMVSPNGTIYAIKPGQATVMATTVDGGFVALCKVTVKEKVIAETILLSNSSEKIAIGESIQLKATIEPEGVTNKKINWASTKTDIATVDDTGFVKAISEGTTQIIATTTDGSNLSATCEIIVLNSDGLKSITVDKSSYVSIYNLSGNLIYEGIYSDAKIDSGIYIIKHNGKYSKAKIN